MISIFLTFAASAAVIIYAGTKLSRYADQIADLTGLGRLWIGVVLLAGATSLPEVFTTVSAGLLGEPDIAAGDLFGAGMTNMLTLGLIDQLHRRKRVWQHAAFQHTLVASLAIFMTGLAGLFVLLGLDLAHGGIGIGGLLLLMCYILGIRLVFRQEAGIQRQKELERVVEDTIAAEKKGISNRAAIKHISIRFATAAAALLISAPFLASSAGDIADRTGLSASFVGTSLVAITTSLPELVTSLAAVRLGAFDLAVGNLFGSNAFNMAALFFADIAYRDGSLFHAVSQTHALTALWSILLMNIGLMGIIYRVEKHYLLIEPDSFVIIFGYLLGLWVLFQ